MDEMRTPRHVGPDERGILVGALGDSPETVISVHLLVRGLYEAYVAGDPARFCGLIVQAHQTSGEPTGFGSDARTLWELLKAARGWWCVNVSEVRLHLASGHPGQDLWHALSVAFRAVHE